MKAIIGLGNPDEKYSKTRHNVGYMVVGEIIRRLNLNTVDKFNSFFAKSEDMIFLMPKTYMNNSGRAVVDLMRFYKLNYKDILVIFDDVTLPLGKIRIRANGSDGGHNGVKSIIQLTGTNKFARIKVGIGMKPEEYTLDKYVLANFTHSEIKTLQDAISKASDAANEYIDGLDIPTLQNKYN